MFSFNFLLIIHLIIVCLMITFIMFQKNEGGGLLNTNNMRGLMSASESANFMTRGTAILAGLFFITSIVLVMLTGGVRSHAQSILDKDPLAVTTKAPASSEIPTQSSGAIKNTAQPSNDTPSQSVPPQPKPENSPNKKS